MNEILCVSPEQLPEAAAFASRQFGLDFFAFQPKLYRCPETATTFLALRDGRPAGMVSVYFTYWQTLRCASVGSVCTAPEFRGQGVMTALFAHLERTVFPDCDLITLCGQRRRYEHFGFAKAVWLPEYSFFPRPDGAPVQLRPAQPGDQAFLWQLWQDSGSGTRRSSERMLDLLRSAGNDVYVLRCGERLAYLSGRQEQRLLTELCGEVAAQEAADGLAQLWGPGKITVRGAYNRLESALLSACDSCALRRRGNIRLQHRCWTYLTGLKDPPALSRLYDIFSGTGGAPPIRIPASLFYLDGI